MTTEATPGTSLAGTLSIQYQFSRGAFHVNVQDVSHEESLRMPGEAGHCMNWVVGHLVASRNQVLALLTLPPLHPPRELERYVRGSSPLTDASEAIDFPELVSDYEKSQEKIVEALARTTPEQLAAPLPEEINVFRLDNVGEMLAALLFHEVYHVGQLGVLRRLIGKEPGIR